MPNVSAFQKADRLALLVAIDEFFELLGELPTSEEATKVAFKIRRCEYEGDPADVKNLVSLTGMSKTKVLNQIKILQEGYDFEFRTVKDPLDNRRSVQRLYGAENPATTIFFDKCLAVVDRLVKAREEAKKLLPEPDAETKAPVASPLAAVVSNVTRGARLIPLAAAGWVAAWLVFDTDKVDDVNRWTTTLLELIEVPAEHFFDGPDHRARDTAVRFAQAADIVIRR